MHCSYQASATISLNRSLVISTQGRTKGMKVAFGWILLQAVGNVMYVYGCVLYETVIMPEIVISFPAAAYMYSHSTRIAGATAWLLGEAYVLSRMYEFQSVFAAPDH
ncbi:uncharacterized protein LOC125947423 isoform X1 [Dermacentor silvarum]|uniref:uncharacterized protein LOC125947423 isoform X1 n=1 Tax=Dermacentor silvarum TaxID=543639 RepID=UPI002100B273|nr:uncharacterized protein LOC125947423 isoform X1 [Dermacentor silvarum]